MDKYCSGPFPSSFHRTPISTLISFESSICSVMILILAISILVMSFSVIMSIGTLFHLPSSLLISSIKRSSISRDHYDSLHAQGSLSSTGILSHLLSLLPYPSLSLSSHFFVAIMSVVPSTKPMDSLLRSGRDSSIPSVTTVYPQYTISCRLQKKSLEIFEGFNEVFTHLPLSCLVADSILCMHGGISSKMKTRDDIMKVFFLFLIPPFHYSILFKIPKPLKDVSTNPIATDLLWADPMIGLPWLSLRLSTMQ